MHMEYSQEYIVMIVITLMIVIDTHIRKQAMLTNWNIMNISGQKKRGINMTKYEHCDLETLEGIEKAERLVRDGWIITNSTPFSLTMIECEHDNTEYIPYESDTNVQENYICLDCGINLPLPEEDIDGQIKEHTVRT